ncbi:hypothetical protein CLU97_0584 [Chryseobacterium sp. 7]|nr:hypothetical protein CLU97_0584 [Chryseobacterium sp. 7]
MQVEYKFMKEIPQNPAQGVLYISIQYKVAVHLCACGCKNKVVTRLSPKDWKLIFDGQSITLYPSIGNWNFTCQSHYWIRNNEFLWIKEEKPRKKKKKFFSLFSKKNLSNN